MCSILELNWNQRLAHKKTKLDICHHMLTSSTQLQNRSFHVVERTRTSAKCQKMKDARAKRAKILFFIVKYANLWGFCCRRRRGCLSSLFEVLTTTRARSRKPFILYLYMKIICGKQVKVHFAYFVQLEQLRTIPEHLSLRKVLFNVTLLLQQLSWLLKIAPPNKVKKIE